MNDLIDALRIRVDVFVLEQGCPPGWDPAEIDKEADHFLATIDGQPVGSVRLRCDEPGSYKIECMAVRAEARRQGVGSALTTMLVKEALERSCRRLWMQAQHHAQNVYEACGFINESTEPYDLYNLGIKHITMSYPVARATEPEQAKAFVRPTRAVC